MKNNEEKYDQAWAKWESTMEAAKAYLEAASDLSSAIKEEDKLIQLSSKKIQITINELQAAKALVEKLEFAESLED